VIYWFGHFQDRLLPNCWQLPDWLSFLQPFYDMIYRGDGSPLWGRLDTWLLQHMPPLLELLSQTSMPPDFAEMYAHIRPVESFFTGLAIAAMLAAVYYANTLVGLAAKWRTGLGVIDEAHTPESLSEK
jgi:hypothetical protein